MSVLLDINSLALFNSKSLKMHCLISRKVWSIVWEYSMKVSVLFDMKYETCLLLLVVTDWNFLARIFVCFFFCCCCCFLPNVSLLYASGFHACIFLPLGQLWLKNNIVYIWFSWSFSLLLFPASFQVEKSWIAQWLSSSGSFRLVSL